MRRARPPDASVYHQLWTERDPRVPAHRQLDDDGRPTVDDIARDLAARQGDSESRFAKLLTVEVRETGQVIGYCGLVIDDTAGAEPELAFELLAAFHGHGYATEAAEAAIGWARTCGVTRLQATVWDWNVASRRVLEKLGFHETGRIDRTLGTATSLITELDLRAS
ncbi:GNAT family N-acetyltransferase [Microbacterium aoyamense]|uniref:GNAT family N-acetyltransferase n=1 Tax=Microbacterium aoyamense TaxID=344166 RepID=UPI0031DE01C2